jgi:hypothetical protein
MTGDNDYRKIGRATRLSDGRQPWDRPTFRRLHAIDAQDGAGPGTDSLNPS